MKTLRREKPSQRQIALLLLLTIFALLTGGNAQETAERQQLPGYLGESERFQFYNHYWLNMHHFLQKMAMIAGEQDAEPEIRAQISQFSAPDKSEYDAAVTFYTSNLVEKDLRTSEYMYNFKRWVISQKAEKLMDVPPDFQTHVEALNRFDDLYKSAFWESHKAANEGVLKDNLDLILSTEEKAVEQLQQLTGQYWQSQKIRVDITIFGKLRFPKDRDKPYTTISPSTHIIMTASAAQPAGNWLELLYHEASHHLISGRWGFVGATIRNVAKVTQKKTLRSMWHAYLFYFSGVVTRDLLASEGLEDYELYMVRNGVYSDPYAHLETHLTKYINNEMTLAEATRLIIDDYEKVITQEK